MSYKILHRADIEIFRLPEVKNYLRISHDYDDMWLGELINSSIEAAENFLRLKLVATRIETIFQAPQSRTIKLPLMPIARIISLTAKISEAKTELIENYEIDEGILKLQHLPTNQSLKVEYIAGFEDQSKIPSAIRQGILLHTAQTYESQGSASSISSEVERLYQPYRRMRI
jgi:uncharacterized phiE125 gp8 family phage protein